VTDGRVYRSPLGARYASPPMQAVWSERHKIGVWRRLWLALAEAQRELGVAVPQAAIDEMRAHLDDVDLALAADYERRFRHDVMAHVHAFGDQAPSARPFLHLGATSAYVSDNADLFVMREGLGILLGRLAAVLEALRAHAARHRATATLAYTHYQPAQLTTVGKRVCLWMQDFALDVDAILDLVTRLPLRGAKGTTGTQASFLDLFNGDHEKVRELDARVARAMGFAGTFPITGQTYPRKLDTRILGALSGIAQSASKFANDLRLLQHDAEMLEPFEPDQIGSSAMPYKRNPMRAERIASLARYVIELAGNAAHTAAVQWLERTLDDSANRRLVLPEAFLATDAILVLATNVAAGLEVREAAIAARVHTHMPFIATERWLMLGVRAGGDRQTLHEVIRRASLEAARRVEAGEANDLLARLARDTAFKAVPAEALEAELTPTRYTGRAPEQVDEFLHEVIGPLLARARSHAPDARQADVHV